ncbi:MAG: hypothetical protein AAGJ46_06235 [Planctomycetota bacterium]
MPRDRSNASELPGQDSFLDIVANLVGILILLVMVVSLRAAQGSPAEKVETPEPPPAEQLSAAEVEEAVHTALAQRKDALEKLAKAEASREALQLREAERDDLAAFVAGLDDEIEERRSGMDEQKRRDFDLRAKLGAAEHELEQLTRERISILPAEPKVEEIENLPTPMAKQVKGDEIHLRLNGGLVAPIPWERLTKLSKDKVESQLWRVSHRDTLAVTVGPIEGFRLKCYLVKQTFVTSQGTASGVRLVRAVVLPTSDVLGETIDEATQPHSAMLRHINSFGGRRKPPITVSIYPDSFDEFRQLKEFLFKQGYAVAGHPLPAGTPIASSPSGRRSAAQ